MRTRTDVTTNVAETTYYGCDRCDFESEYEDDLKKHVVQNHLVVAKTTVDGEEWLYFLTEEDYKAYLDGQDGWSGQILRDGKWDGPGWYGSIEQEEPCARGCCTYHQIRLYSADWFLKEEQERVRTLHLKIQKSIATVATLRDLKKKVAIAGVKE